MNKPLLRELAWLMLAIAITLVLAIFVFDWKFSDRTIDINLHDSYYVFPPEIFLIPLFAAICFLIFLIKEIKNYFSRKLPAIIIIACATLLVAVLTKLTKLLTYAGGYVLYPPLTRVRDVSSDEGFDTDVNILLNLILIIQCVVMLIAVFVAYRLGISKIKKA